MSYMKNRKKYKMLTWCSLFFPINLFFFGWFLDLFYMDKVFDELMTQRGYINTAARNNEEG